MPTATPSLSPARISSDLSPVSNWRAITSAGINLNDGENAIGIWCRHSQLDAVRFVGDYKNKGDTLEIEGRFNRACPLHGGELDIHAESVKIIKEGYAIEEKTDSKKLNLAIAVFSIVLLIAVIFRKRL